MIPTQYISTKIISVFVVSQYINASRMRRSQLASKLTKRFQTQLAQLLSVFTTVLMKNQKNMLGAYPAPHKLHKCIKIINKQRCLEIV